MQLHNKTPVLRALTSSLMKFVVFLFFLYFKIFNLNAQVEADSLWAIWQNESLQDSTRTYALVEYIYSDYFYTHPDSAILLGQELYEFTQDAQFHKGSVDALRLLGYAYFRMGDYDSALVNYTIGLEVAEEIEDKTGMAWLLLRTGYIYHDNGNLSRALNYYQKCEQLFLELNDKDGLSSVYNEYGSIWKEQHEFGKSLEYYLKAVAFNNETGEEEDNTALFMNIADIYLDQSDSIKSMNYYKHALALYKKNNDKLGISSVLTCIGDVYLLQNKEDKALDFLHRSLKISQEISYIPGINSILVKLAQIDIDREQFSKAISYCKRSLRLSQELGDVFFQLESCDCLYNSYKMLGNINKALFYHEQMRIFTDSLQSNRGIQAIQQMEFSKQVLADSLLQIEKRAEVDLAHQAIVYKKDKNRNIAIGMGLFFLLLSGGFFSRWRYVQKSKKIIEKERDRSESLLLNILPAEIAEELKEKGEAAARDFDLVSILFTDFKGFTEKSEKLSAKELIKEINHCFMAFDHICEKYQVEKIKTIGDAYMAAGGLPVPFDNAVENTVLAALEMQDFIRNRAKFNQANDQIHFDMRVGIHTGPVVAGIVGIKKFQYDIWGDTVNTAARMESAGDISKVNISQFTYEFIKNNTKFTFEERGEIQVKGKADMHMWFVEKRTM